MSFKWLSFDGWLGITQLGLVVFGLVGIKSVAPTLFWPQASFFLIGLGIYLLVMRLDYRIYSRLTPLLYLFSLLILILPLFLGFELRGSTRWLRIGWFNFQPSEIVKPFLALVFARYFSQEKALTGKRLVGGLLLLALPVVLVFSQPDLGSSLVIVFLWLGVVLTVGVSKWWLAGSALVFILLRPIVWSLLKEYQKERIISFFQPQNDPLGAGYHLIQATVAVGSGQLFGRGLERGTQSHLRFLPERQTDFVFASLAEELGLIGSLILLVLISWLLMRILKIAERSDDEFGRLICLGVFFWVFSQMAMNVGINLGLLPVTGVTLPLISYGGSSIVAVMIGLGLVQSVAMKRQPRRVIEIQ